MANRVTAIENFMGLNRECSTTSAEGNLGDVFKYLKAEFIDMKAQIQVLNQAIRNQGPNQGVPGYGQ